MSRIITFAAVASAAAVSLAGLLAAQTPATARADFIGLDGASHGTATLTQAGTGVLIRADLIDLPEGAHGFHVHETGACEMAFESAGDHFNPADAAHGALAADGPEPGDMPNIHVPASGAATVEVLNTAVTLAPGAETSLLDADGAALMIHADADDYATQPGGGAGDRIACAVLRP